MTFTRRSFFASLTALFVAPVFAATLGPTTLPGGAANPASTTILASPLYTMTEAGNITSVSVAAQDDTASDGVVQVRLYSSTGATLASSSTSSTLWNGTPSFQSVAISYSASASQQIRIAVFYNGSEFYAMVDNAGTGLGFSAGDHTPFTWPSDNVTFTQDFDWQLGAYITYTPTGSSPVLKILQQAMNSRKALDFKSSILADVKALLPHRRIVPTIQWPYRADNRNVQ